MPQKSSHDFEEKYFNVLVSMHITHIFTKKHNDVEFRNGVKTIIAVDKWDQVCFVGVQLL